MSFFSSLVIIDIDTYYIDTCYIDKMQHIHIPISNDTISRDTICSEFDIKSNDYHSIRLGNFWLSSGVGGVNRWGSENYTRFLKLATHATALSVHIKIYIYIHIYVCIYNVICRILNVRIRTFCVCSQEKKCLTQRDMCHTFFGSNAKKKLKVKEKWPTKNYTCTLCTC